MTTNDPPRMARAAAALAGLSHGRMVSDTDVAYRYGLDPATIERDLLAFGWAEPNPPSIAATLEKQPGWIAVLDVDDRLRYRPDLAAGERFRLISLLGTWASLPARHLSTDLLRAAEAVRDRIGPLHARFVPRPGAWVDDIAEPIRAAALWGHDMLLTTAAGKFRVAPSSLVHEHGCWMVQGTERPSGRPVRLRLVDISEAETIPPCGATEARPGHRPGRSHRRGPRITFTVDVADGWWLEETHPTPVAAISTDQGTLTCTLEIWPEQRPWLEGLLPRLGPTLRITAIDPVLGPPTLARDIAQRILARYAEGGSGSGPA